MIVKELDWITIKDKIFEFENKPLHINLWSDLGIWKLKNEDLYSEWLKQKICELKLIIKEFDENGFSMINSEKYSVNYNFLRKLTLGIARFQNIYDALFYVNGWKGLLGLELAKVRLKLFYEKNQRFPTQREMETISNKIIHKKKYWKKFGINTWNDLLRETFGQVNKDYNMHKGMVGLKDAKKELINFYNTRKRLPTARDKEMITYSNAIVRGVWKEYGINTWNDLLNYIFKEVNKSNKLYTGRSGLNRAKSELSNYYKIHNKKPTSTIKEVSSILVAIKRRYWSEFGIKTWNDLLKLVFGTVNVRKGIWTGEEGFKRAKEKLKKYSVEFGRIPTRRSSGLGGIVKAIQRGYWKKFDITSWNDLLFIVFGKGNQRKSGE